MNKSIFKIIISVLLVAAIALSFTSGAAYFTSTENHADTIQKLDEKRATVLKLTAATAGASLVISMLPGDIGTPIADEVADLSSYLVLVLCAIYLEKYLLIITGYAACYLLIPAACLLALLSVWSDSDWSRAFAIKLASLGVAMVLVVPASVWATNKIEDTYQASLDNALQIAEEEQLDPDFIFEAPAETEDGVKEEPQKKSLWETITGAITGVTETVSNNISTFTAEKLEEVKSTVNRIVEALAVMIVTSCLIPLLVMLFFLWLIRSICGITIPITRHCFKPSAVIAAGISSADQKN